MDGATVKTIHIHSVSFYIAYECKISAQSLMSTHLSLVSMNVSHKTATLGHKTCSLLEY
jgi:hypothetical protein